MEGYLTHHWCKVPRGNTTSRVKIFELTHLLAIRNFRPSEIMEGYFTHHWCKVPRGNTPFRVKIFKFYSSDCTTVKSSKSEFLAVVRPKWVKNHGGILYTPPVLRSEGKYSFQGEIFRFGTFDRGVTR